jgi:hypothetical protein
VPAKTNWKSLLKLFQAISLKELDRLQFLLWFPASGSNVCGKRSVHSHGRGYPLMLQCIPCCFVLIWIKRKFEFDTLE